MSEPLSREKLIERLAEVSHATWIVQGVRDYYRSLSDPSGKILHAEGSEEWRSDLADAQALLHHVLEGKSLRDLSDNPHHWPLKHDTERAELAVQELERLGALPGS